MSVKHTPEPWRLRHNGNHDGDRSISANGREICRIDGGANDNCEDFSNGRRIVASVNACAGIPTEALESGVVAEMREALERMTKLASLVTVGMVVAAGDEYIEAAGLNPWCVNEGTDPNARISTQLARAVLAKLTPQ